MSEMTFWVLAILVALSIAIPYFWCRYLCPYGALLGAVSWLSPYKIRRNLSSCIDCKKCTKVCPAKILVHKEKTVFSDECHTCLQCVDSCPVKDTLYLAAPKHKLRISRKAVAWVVVIIFTAGTFLARLAGVWQTSISPNEYLYHMKHLDMPQYHHNQGEVAGYDKDKWQKEPEKKSNSNEK
jgi:polyferredoxin